MMQGSVLERLATKFEVRDDGCWEWIAGLDSNGYGQFWVKGHNSRAHRTVWEEVVGVIPDGLHLDHLCRNIKCVNPDHLEPVTCRENLLRGNTANARNVLKTHCSKGHEFTDENTYVSTSGKRKCRECNRVMWRAAYYARKRRG
jgi:hypothetical protein